MPATGELSLNSYLSVPAAPPAFTDPIATNLPSTVLLRSTMNSVVPFSCDAVQLKSVSWLETTLPCRVTCKGSSDPPHRPFRLNVEILVRQPPFTDIFAT